MNFIRLNQITIPDKYSLARIEQIIYNLNGNKFFSKIDLKNGYYHIAVKKEDQCKTAFKVNNKLYKWKVMPQGLINAPTVFQRYMDGLLKDLLGRYCYVYIDDILIFGKDEKSHEEAFRKVTERLIETNLQGNMEKIEYRRERVKFLGHVIEKNKIMPFIDKADAIEKMEESKNNNDVQKFMGLINYYRKFIRNCADKSGCPLQLLQKDVSFTWGQDQE